MCVSKWDRFTAPNVCQTFVVFVPCYFYYKMLRPQFLRLTWACVDPLWYTAIIPVPYRSRTLLSTQGPAVFTFQPGPEWGMKGANLSLCRIRPASKRANPSRNRFWQPLRESREFLQTPNCEIAEGKHYLTFRRPFSDRNLESIRLFCKFLNTHLGVWTNTF